MENIQLLFEKNFKFKNLNYKLPTEIALNDWTDEYLQNLKKELNETKKLLNDKDLIKWRRHTNYTNKAAHIIFSIKKRFDVNFLTQAWCKFFEVLNKFTLIKDEENRTLHLCEAPGAFVDALSTYLKARSISEKWSWIANTLNPFYEGHSMDQTIFDDRFILNTLENWYFGSKNKGDITDPSFLDNLINDQIKGKKIINLITADGSIDCHNEPEEQEAKTHFLHFTELCLAFHILGPKGNLVIKMFTFFESSSICLMYTLVCAFDEVNVYKPATSKPGNSEVYVVCLGFNSEKIESILPVFKENLALCASRPLFRKDDIPLEFLEQQRECCQKFFEYQKATILENIDLFTNFSEGKKMFLNLYKEECVNIYIRKCFAGIPEKEEPYKAKRGKRKNFEKNEWSCKQMKLNSQSYNIRKSLIKKSYIEQLKSHKRDLEDIQMYDCSEPSHKLLGIKITPEPKTEWIIIGDQFSRIQSSKFCCNQSLKIWNQVSDLIKTPDETAFNSILDEHSINSLVTSFKNVDVLIEGETGQTIQRIINQNVNVEDKKAILYLFDFQKHDEIKIESKSYFLKRIQDILNISNNGDSLLLIMPSLLTRLFVGVIYMLVGSYEEVEIEIEKSGNFQFWKFSIYKKSLKIISYLEEIIKCEIPVGSTLLEVVPIYKIIESEFYPVVTFYNKKQISLKLENIFNKKLNIPV